MAFRFSNRPSFVLAAFVILGSMGAAAHVADPPDLEIALGETNHGTGVTVPSAGDGVNTAEQRAGVALRRIAAGSGYLYVTIDHPAYRVGPRDVYVTVDVLDDAPGRLQVQYDRAAAVPDVDSKYTDSGELIPLVGSGRWLSVVFPLPALRLGRGQNHGADFRLAGERLAVRRIRVSSRPPAGYDPAHPNRAELLRGLAVTRPPGMELTYGNDATPGQAARFQALSVTSVESYVDWAGVEPSPGQWDWSKWDRQVATLKAAGLKWVPFLIAGPAYATPAWFHKSPESRYDRCLEHDRESRVQSLFNPALKARVDTFLKAFAARYRDADVIESVLLGVTGIYGESIYPAGPEGGWTTRVTGPYHNHAGWWAGDPAARAAFRAAMAQRHGTIEALNRAWGTKFGGFEQVDTFLPERAASDRARADFVEWYQAAMTDWARSWVESARRVLPKTEIYLCTGGDGQPMLGADFTAQAAAIAPLGAGIRVTNEGSDYTANFSLTREVATATRLYGTFCGFEPASGVDARGVVARIYNATASGARQLHDYIPNTLGGDPQALANFRAHAAWLAPRRPRVEVALYLPRESWALDPRGVGRTQELARVLRDATDVDFLTRRSVQDGHLKGYRVLVLADAPVIEPAAAAAIERWVRGGGTLVAATRPGETLGGRLYDQAAWRGKLFAAAPGPVPEQLAAPALEGEAPGRWRLGVGSADDPAWLTGRWYDRESTSDWNDASPPRMRWSGPRAGVLVPVRPGAEHAVEVALSVRREAIGETGVRIQVGTETLATIRQPGPTVARFRLTPAQADRSGVARLEIAARGWRPAAVDRGSTDQRLLGVAVHRVEVVRAGVGADEPAAPARLVWQVDMARLGTFQRRIDGGTTVLLPGAGADPRTLALISAALEPGRLDGRLDGRFVTDTDQGVIWLDPERPSIAGNRP